jgi:DNA-binding HxlR family transcriptional regulator
MAQSLQRIFSGAAELTLEILGGKWKTVILRHLKDRPMHYGELRALIPRLSDKMLTERLQDLQEIGLVVRHKKGVRGAPSVYEISALGKSLKPALQALYDWGEQVADEMGATIESAEHPRPPSMPLTLAPSRMDSYGGLPAAIQRAKASTISVGQARSQGIVPFRTRSRMASAC